MSEHDRSVIRAIDDVMAAHKLLNKARDTLTGLVDNMTSEERRRWQEYSVEQYGYIISDLLRSKRFPRRKW